MKKIIKIIQSRLNLIKHLYIENLILRQQLAVMKQSIKRPKIRKRDRLFWMIVSRFWNGWKDTLIIFKPETVIRWHRLGFKQFWKFKSRVKHLGRPKINKEIQELIRHMATANLSWGAPRIHGELAKLGFNVASSTVSKYLRKFRPKPPSQTWKTFLKNHMHNTCSMDFLTVHTATFKILYVLVILHNERRKIVHFNVTSNPTAEWTARQIVQAFPWDTAPKYMIRDRDSIYGKKVQRCFSNMEINEVLTAPKSPWQNPYVERLIGSIRRECLNHVLIWHESHCRQQLKSYFDYYNNDRTHLSLDKDPPVSRPVQKRTKNARLVKLPRVGGLHHRYEWREAA